jgi:hypothetical protein
MEITINSYDSYKYNQVWLITEWKDGCVWKVKPIGYILAENKASYPNDKYSLSSISTKLTKGDFCTLSPFLEPAKPGKGGE